MSRWCMQVALNILRGPHLGVPYRHDDVKVSIFVSLVFVLVRLLIVMMMLVSIFVSLVFVLVLTFGSQTLHARIRM